MKLPTMKLPTMLAFTLSGGISVLLLLLVGSNPAFAKGADHDKKKPEKTLTMEQRKELTEAHKKMVVCLESDKDIEECHMALKDKVKGFAMLDSHHGHEGKKMHDCNCHHKKGSGHHPSEGGEKPDGK